MIEGPDVSRRMALTPIGAGALGIGGTALAQDSGRLPVDLGVVQNGKVLFPPPAAKRGAALSATER